MAKSSTAVFKAAIDLLNVQVEFPFKAFNISIERDQDRTTYAVSSPSDGVSTNARVVVENDAIHSYKGAFTITVEDVPHRVDYFIVHGNGSCHGFVDIDGVGRLSREPNDKQIKWLSCAHLKHPFRQPDAATTSAIWGAMFNVAQRLKNRLSRVDLL